MKRITIKLKWNKAKKKEPRVRIQTDKDKKLLFAEKKKERGWKKDWIEVLVEEVVKEKIKVENIS